jgi:predicted phosphoribosyltransferase
MDIRFADRVEAGRVLTRELVRYREDASVIVLGLPRGGIPVAFEVAQGLEAPLHVFVVRKLGVPGHEELAMGAIATGGIRVLNDDVIAGLRISDRAIEAVAEREQRELERRERDYRSDRPFPSLEGRTVILVDDGLATGSTMRAAVAALRKFDPARIVVAVPVGAVSTCALLREEADEVVCAMTPEPFQAVGLWYRDFDQTTDDEVRELLRRGETGDVTQQRG